MQVYRSSWHARMLLLAVLLVMLLIPVALLYLVAQTVPNEAARKLVSILVLGLGYFFLLPLILLGVIYYLRLFQTKLILSQQGVEYSSPGHRVMLKWSEIEGMATQCLVVNRLVLGQRRQQIYQLSGTGGSIRFGHKLDKANLALPETHLALWHKQTWQPSTMGVYLRIPQSQAVLNRIYKNTGKQPGPEQFGL